MISISRKRTNEEFIKEVYDLVEEEYVFLEEYINVDTKIKVLHRDCDKTYFVTPNKFFNNRRCPYCKSKRLSKKNAWTQERFEEEVKLLYKDEYEVIGEYINSHTELEIKHFCCGGIERYMPYSFFNGKRCSICFKDHKKSHHHFEKEVLDLVGGEYIILTEYKLSDKKVIMRHNECKLEYEVTPSAFLSGRRCPVCSQEAGFKKRARSAEEIEVIFNKKFKGEFTILGNYTGMRDHILIRHNTCGQEWTVILNSYLYGEGGCPKCRESKGEKRIRNYLESNDINFIPQYRIAECRDKYPLPFDFVVLDDNSSILFLLEYDGEGHFFPIPYSKDENINIAKFEAIKRRDQIKNQHCIDNSIPLVRIPYWEFDEIEVILEIEMYNLGVFAI